MSLPVCYHCKEAFIRDSSGKRYNRFSLVVKVHPGSIPLGQAMSELLETNVPSSPTDFVCDRCFSTAKTAFTTKKTAEIKVREFKLNLHHFTKRMNLAEFCENVVVDGDDEDMNVDIIEESYDQFMKIHIESVNEDQTVTADDIQFHLPTTAEQGEISPSCNVRKSQSGAPIRRRIRRDKTEKKEANAMKKEKNSVFSKSYQDKQAWSWAESTEPDDVTNDHVQAAYRMTVEVCRPNKCRRNCKGSPRCLNFIGERNWLGKIEDSQWHDIQDPETERRKPGALVGLKNLGATCYVNTFLQVWFHNHEFRRGIYKWNDPDQPAVAYDSADFKLSEEEEQMLLPKSAVGQLQFIFGLLEGSKRRYVDPTSFIKCLGLDTGQQQDAQEFSKLFIAMLESSLSQQTDPMVRDLVHDQFNGQYSYVTTCSNCGLSSERESSFFELDLNIKGHKDIGECIQEFLGEEKLEGDNRYHCPQCMQKRDANRIIKLRKLPKILNMQLLRFVFQRETSHKKKLNTYIDFPEELDMAPYMEDSGNFVYTLSAVLIHRGPSAYSGHYVAHIRDEKTEAWYKINDEATEKIAGKNLQLGNEEEVTGGNKKPKTAKGHHASRNAYMLVYRRKLISHDQASRPAAGNDGIFFPSELTNGPQPNIKLLVDNDNVKFEDWIIEMKKMQVDNVARGNARQEEIKQLWPLLQPTEDSGHEWIAHDWLTKWTDSDIVTVPPIDNEAVLCPHEKMDPHKITSFKCINANTAEIFYSKYNGKPRLKSDMMCVACVTEQCRISRTKSRIVEDHKFISDTLKVCGNGGDFWVGKLSLRGWKKMALEEIGDDCDEKDRTDRDDIDIIKNNKTSEDVSVKTEDPQTEEADNQKSNSHNQKSDSLEEVDKNGSQKTDSRPSCSQQAQKLERNCHPWPSFNEDLLCRAHKDLSTEMACRRLVPASVWNKLKVYFPSAPEFTNDSIMCKKCLNADEEEAEKAEVHRAIAAEQKAQLLDLYQKTRTPLVWGTNVTDLNVIPKEFLIAWRRFIRDPITNEPLSRTGTDSLLCPHGGLPCQLDLIGMEEDDECELIWPRQWDKIQKLIPGDEKGIFITRVQEDDGTTTYLSSPDVCEECLVERIEEEFQSKLNYKSGTIFIRKITMDTIPGTIPPAMRSDSPTDSHVSVASSNDSGQDPEFIEVNGKRKKISQNGGEKQLKVDASGSTRRSSRHRKVRGEKEVTVSSTQTLRELKVQIMKHFSVAPFDQHLTVDGQEIKAENDCTLSSLRIIPGSVIYLKADEPAEDPIFLDDITTANYPEEGFKGTGLLGQ